MKILVLSLLRMGDVIMTEPVLRAIKRKHPDSCLDILVNDNFADKLNGIVTVDRFISFPRKKLQEELANPSVGLFNPLNALNEFVEDLKNENYDYVINLTQNKISARLLSELNAPTIDGLSLNAFDKPFFSNKWFRYLNNANGQGQTPQFHMVDIFSKALGINTISSEEFSNSKTHRRVALQLFTSDRKKNWSIESWFEFVRLFSMTHPDYEIDVLGAPFEEAQVQQFVDTCADSNIKVNKQILSLKDCLAHLANCDLLITGDTSVKHLGAMADCKVLEIALGSSEVNFTGVYKHGSMIVTSRASCFPCVHREDCHQSHHRCGEQVEPELIQMLTSSYLINDLQQIKVLSNEYADMNSIFRVTLDSDGFNLNEIKDSFSDKDLKTEVDRLMWQFYLSDGYLNPISEIGSSSHKILKKIIDKGGSHFADLRNWVAKQEEFAESNLKTSCSLLHKVSFDRNSILQDDYDQKDIDNIIVGNPYVGINIATHTQNLKSHFRNNSEVNFKSLRLLQENLNTAKNLFEIKKKVFRTIKCELTEKI